MESGFGEREVSFYVGLNNERVEPGARANAATKRLGVVHLCGGRVAQLTRSHENY